jgi:hypothetical protein
VVVVVGVGGGGGAAGGGLLCGALCLRRAVWCVLLWGGGTRACLPGGVGGARGNEFVITAWRSTRCMENISCVGQYWMRGTTPAAWGNIGCVGHSWESTARSTAHRPQKAFELRGGGRAAWGGGVRRDGGCFAARGVWGGRAGGANSANSANAAGGAKQTPLRKAPIASPIIHGKYNG